MDETLRQLLAGMFELSQDNDRLRARNTELEQAGQQQIAMLQAQLVLLSTEQIPPGWRLVRDA